MSLAGPISPWRAAARPAPAGAPRRPPTFYVETRAAWEGSWPGRPDIPVRIEAAAHRGRPAWFEGVWPWTRPERRESYAWPPAKVLRADEPPGSNLVLLRESKFR